MRFYPYRGIDGDAHHWLKLNDHVAPILNRSQLVFLRSGAPSIRKIFRANNFSIDIAAAIEIFGFFT